jgi:Peptidase_C39 like family
MAPGDTGPRALAWIELNMLNYADVLPLEGAVMKREPTDVYDINGEVLFQRFPIDGPQGRGFADAAADPRLGAPLVAAAPSGEWNEAALLEQAAAAFRKRFRDKQFDRARFVAFSFPKIGVQFLSEGEEIALLELFTWEPVPPARTRPKGEPPANFERWSFLEELDPRVARTRRSRFTRRVTELEPILVKLDEREFFTIEKQLVAPLVDIAVLLTDTRQLHYSKNNADHEPCYEVRGQQTNVWCVGASVQMLLDFYRYEYLQTRLATELGLGTLANPNGLPYSRVGDVVTVIERLTSNALNATMNTAPNWTEFRNEIRANRPMISFIPGHSRTIAGYTVSNIFVISPFRGLLVYDPWPPTSGVITRWENFATQTYSHAYTARVTLV